MATSPSRVAWDSCTWIAHIQREKILAPDGKTVIEDRGAMCRLVLDAAERGVIEIIVSAISLVEVLARNRTGPGRGRCRASGARSPARRTCRTCRMHVGKTAAGGGVARGNEGSGLAARHEAEIFEGVDRQA